MNFSVIQMHGATIKKEKDLYMKLPKLIKSTYEVFTTLICHMNSIKVLLFFKIIP